MPDRRTVHLYPESIAVDRREPTWGPDATREADVAHCRANCPDRSRGHHSYECAQRAGLA